MQLNNVSSENWCDCSSMIIHGHNCMFMSRCYYQSNICWYCLFILLFSTMKTDITILYCQNTVTTISNYSSDQSMWLYVIMTILNWKLLLHCFTNSTYYQSMKNIGNYFVLNINSTEYYQKTKIYIQLTNTTIELPETTKLNIYNVHMLLRILLVDSILTIIIIISIMLAIDRMNSFFIYSPSTV